MSTYTERRGLGRGLGELFQRTEAITPARTDTDESDADGPQPASVPVPEGSYFAELPIGSITPNPRQPRTVFDEDALSELVDSIREVGLLQPIVVRPLGGGPVRAGDGGAAVASRSARPAWTPFPAIVRRTEDHDLLRDALLENLHRAQLNPLEEAAAYQQMLEDFGCTQDELSTRIKRSRPQISNTIRLLKLPPSVQRRVAAGVLSAGHARALLGLPDQAAQERLPSGSSPRASRSGRSRRSSPWASPDESRLRAGVRPGPPALAPTSWPAALRPLRHPGAGGPGQEQGQDHDRVRHGRGSGADRGRHAD